MVDAGAVDAGPCPSDLTEALSLFTAEGCPRGFEPGTIVSGPTTGSPAGDCCYMVHLVLCGAAGRPYQVDDHAQLAALERGAGSGGWSCSERPDLDGLTPEERASLAETWAAAALFEHGSVASFARFSLELLAAGAPADLLAASHQAAVDEIEHARLCFGLASAYAGEAMAPGPFPLGGEVRLGAGLADLAASTAVEGCLGETVAALVAAEQLARATDPAVRAALTRIAEDEAQHAELAWRTVAWAVRTGGSEVQVAVERALLEAFDPAQPLGHAGVPCSTTKLEAHGLLDDTVRAQIVAGALADVIAPAARALLPQRAVRPDCTRATAS